MENGRESAEKARSNPPCILHALGEAALCCPIRQSLSLPPKTLMNHSITKSAQTGAAILKHLELRIDPMRITAVVEDSPDLYDVTFDLVVNGARKAFQDHLEITGVPDMNTRIHNKRFELRIHIAGKVIPQPALLLIVEPAAVDDIAMPAAEDLNAHTPAPRRDAWTPPSS